MATVRHVRISPGLVAMSRARDHSVTQTPQTNASDDTQAERYLRVKRECASAIRLKSQQILRMQRGCGMNNRERALMDAIDRDLRDAERLEHIIGLTSTLLDALIPDMDPLEHPDIRWHPGDLADALADQLKSMRHELGRVRSLSVVLADE